MPQEKNGALMNRAARKKVITHIIAFLKEKGATPVGDNNKFHHGDVTLILNTPVGPLVLYPDTDVEGQIVTVCTRFLVIQQASDFLAQHSKLTDSDKVYSVSPKWNFHWDCRAINAIGVYLEFTDAVEKLLAFPPASPVMKAYRVTALDPAKNGDGTCEYIVPGESVESAKQKWLTSSAGRIIARLDCANDLPFDERDPDEYISDCVLA